MMDMNGENFDYADNEKIENSNFECDCTRACSIDREDGRRVSNCIILRSLALQIVYSEYELLTFSSLRLGRQSERSHQRI